MPQANRAGSAAIAWGVRPSLAGRVRFRTRDNFVPRGVWRGKARKLTSCKSMDVEFMTDGTIKSQRPFPCSSLL